MRPSFPENPARVTKSPFRRVGENLYRYAPSGVYYALLKRGDKQFRRSLRTPDRKLAERRLSELRQQVGNLSTDEDPNVGFVELAERWLQTVQHTLKASTVNRRRRCIKALAPFFRNLTVRNITPRHCEQWLTERGREIAAQTFAHELDTMRAVFTYAINLGVILSSPSKDIKRRKIKACAGADSFRREERVAAHLEAARQQVQAMDDPRADESARQRAARERVVRERQSRLEQALEQLTLQRHLALTLPPRSV